MSPTLSTTPVTSGLESAAQPDVAHLKRLFEVVAEAVAQHVPVAGQGRDHG
jgi:hypothetical protein